MRCVFTTNTSSQGIRPRLSSQNLLILNPLNLSTPQYLHKWSVDQINATYSKFEYLPMYIEQSIHQFWVLKEVIINCQNWRKCMKYNLGYIKSFFFSKKMNHLMSDPAENRVQIIFLKPQPPITWCSIPACTNFPLLSKILEEKIFKYYLIRDWQTRGPLQDPVTWYGINYAGMQVRQWDFQNEGTCTSPARLSFVLEVPLCNLRPSVINSVPCDRILQSAYCSSTQTYNIQPYTYVVVDTKYEWITGRN